MDRLKSWHNSDPFQKKVLNAMGVWLSVAECILLCCDDQLKLKVADYYLLLPAAHSRLADWLTALPMKVQRPEVARGGGGATKH